MSALDAAIATRADDKGSMVAKALLEHHVCGRPTRMKTHTNVKLADKVVQVTLKRDKKKKQREKKKNMKNCSLRVYVILCSQWQNYSFFCNH